MPRTVRIAGCAGCPFRVDYRGEWECLFDKGKKVKRLETFFGEHCPLLEEGGMLLMPDTYERDKQAQKGGEAITKNVVISETLIAPAGHTAFLGRIPDFSVDDAPNNTGKSTLECLEE